MVSKAASNQWPKSWPTMKKKLLFEAIPPVDLTICLGIKCDFGALLLQAYANGHSSFRFEVRITTEPLSHASHKQLIGMYSQGAGQPATCRPSRWEMGFKHPFWLGTWWYHGYKLHVKIMQKWLQSVIRVSISAWMMKLLGSYFILVEVMRGTHHFCYIAGVPDPAGLGKHPTVNNIRQQDAIPSRFSFEEAGLIPSIEIPGPSIKKRYPFWIWTLLMSRKHTLCMAFECLIFTKAAYRQQETLIWLNCLQVVCPFAFKPIDLFEYLQGWWTSSALSLHICSQQAFAHPKSV